jgi:uncharacterized protein
VATDDLSAPLGQNNTNTKKPRIVLAIAVPQILAGAMALFVLVFIGWALIGHDPLGGEPKAVVAANPPIPNANPDGTLNSVGQGPNRYDGPVPGQAAKTNPPVTPNNSNTPTQPAPGMQTITIIDGSSGRKQQVEIPIPQDSRTNTTVEQRLLDTSRHGAIPKIGADGARPAEAYARATNLAAAGHSDNPRIAIVVGGLGISVTNTNDALAKLPGPITLAFSPYGTDIERMVGRARADGHEVLLQVPMEPFDYPDNDPGPQTLLTTLLADQNLDRLHWLMSRFQGYVGVVNVMGNRFTATERSFTPVLNEITKRGLLYLDDGISPRSLASQIAGASNLPFAKAEVTIDAVATPGHIDRALSRLEALARERGAVVGVASASPAVIERIAQWAKGAAGRGLVLVPISAIAIKPKAS